MTSVLSRLRTVTDLLSGRRFPLEDEKATQRAIADVLDANLDEWARECSVDGGIIDFRALGDIGVEVKLKGQPAAILRQLERYAADPTLAALVLVTAKPVALPLLIGGKPVRIIDLGKAWL